MKHAKHTEVPKPFDVAMLFGMPGQPFGDAEATYRAWLDGVKAMQAESAEFFNARAGKDMAALSGLVRCQSPAEALEFQTCYATDALSDFVAQGQKMFAMASGIGYSAAQSGK
jgi:hypothetical protein